MKVILIKQVDKLGAPGEIVNVSAGYARNFLFPQNLAEEATAQAVAEIERKKQSKKKKKDAQDRAVQKIKSSLQGQEILIRAKASEEGHLFGGISSKEIVESIAKRKKIEIDPKQIDLPHHLKKLGKHDIVLKLGNNEEIKFIADIQKHE